jgi:tight adherence protein B
VTAAGWVGLLAGAATLVALGPPPSRARLRRVTVSPATSDPQPGGIPVRPGAAVLAVAAALSVAVVLGPGAGLLAGAGAIVAQRWRGVTAARRRADRVRAGLPLVCRALAAELRAGWPAGDALACAARDADTQLAHLLDPAVRAGRLGGDVPAMLHAAARSPGAARLAVLAAGWRVSTDTGASLATLADRLAAALGDEQRHRRLIAAQLAGPRASARLLAALPVVGVLLGVALGADPVRVLLHTPWGLACLTAAIGLDLLGLLWTERLAASAVRMRT